MEQPNINYLHQLCGDDKVFKAKMISIIKIELPEEIADYQEKIAHKKFKHTSECVHKLKHKISVLGLEKSYYIAEKFEENLNNNSTALQNDFEKILSSMQDFVNDL